MNRLVLGCGYLGLRVARLWKSKGDDVYAVTRSKINAEKFEQFKADIAVFEEEAKAYLEGKV